MQYIEISTAVLDPMRTVSLYDKLNGVYRRKLPYTPFSVPY
jgi:hypothetical protein